MSSAVYAEGLRPAVDAQLSLSIVGGRAQPPILKELSRSLRSDYATYVEISRLSRLSTNLSESAEASIQKGESIRAVFQQGHHEVVTLSEMVLLLYAAQYGYLDKLEPAGKTAFCQQIFDFTEENLPSLVRAIDEYQDMTPDIEDGLKRMIKEYFAHMEHEALAMGSGASNETDGSEP